MAEKQEKKRLDTLMVERGLAESREKAQALIMAGDVVVGEARVEKPGHKVPANAEIRLKRVAADYASRGGHKMAGALDDFGIDPAGKRALDVGASTGGFTDCLLRRGAASVCALDVGYGQIAMSLRNDPRVTVMDRTNVRNVKPSDFAHRFDLASIDISFISLLKALPAIAPLIEKGGEALALIKPQFEIGAGVYLGKDGVVKKPEDHKRILRDVLEGIPATGLFAERLTHSRLPGPKGNIEFFVLLKTTPSAGLPPLDPDNVVETAHRELKI